MSQVQLIPSLEKINQRAVEVQKTCQRADAEILILDDLIAQLQIQERSSSLHHYRLNRAKLFLEQAS